MADDVIYRGEAILRGRGESDKAGRWVRLEIDGEGAAHPFRGFEGERFAVVVMGPLASAEHEPVARKGKAGGVPTRKDGRAEADADMSAAGADLDAPPMQLVGAADFLRHLGIMGDAPNGDEGATGSATLVQIGSAPAAARGDSSPTKPKRRWQDISPSQRAGIRMNEREFQEFAAEQMGMLATATTADSFIKWKCDVESKSDIVPGEAALRFEILDGEYQAWRQARGHGVI